MEEHQDIYTCPVVWKGRSSPPSNGSTVTYAGSTPPATSTSTITSSVASSLPSNALGTAASAGPTLRPGATTPKEGIFVVAGGQGNTDDPELNDDDASLDKRTLAMRDDLTRINRISWRRGIPVEPVFSNTLVQPGSASTESKLVAVRLPTIMNVTSGTMGIVLSEQCVETIVWPNQM
jgi:hypothetical protein